MSAACCPTCGRGWGRQGVTFEGQPLRRGTRFYHAFVTDQAGAPLKCVVTSVRRTTVNWAIGYEWYDQKRPRTWSFDIANAKEHIKCLRD